MWTKKIICWIGQKLEIEGRARRKKGKRKGKRECVHLRKIKLVSQPYCLLYFRI
jgi:hypothetical protein